MLSPLNLGRSGALIDGFHRVAAAKHIGRYDVPADEVDIPDDELKVSRATPQKRQKLSGDNHKRSITHLSMRRYKLSRHLSPLFSLLKRHKLNSDNHWACIHQYRRL